MSATHVARGLLRAMVKLLSVPMVEKKLVSI